MLEILGYLIVALIAITAVVVCVKILIALLPILIAICAIGLVAYFFLNDKIDTKKFLPDRPKKEITQKTLPQKIVKVRNEAQRQFHQQMLAMTRQKPGVNLNAIRPEIDSAISSVLWVYHYVVNDDEFKPLITSGNDYEGHAANSAHYANAAIDVRIKDMGNTDERRQIVAMVREELDDRYTILHEDVGNENEHLHIQLKSGSYNKNESWK